jgi:hypothetical protein
MKLQRIRRTEKHETLARQLGEIRTPAPAFLWDIARMGELRAPTGWAVTQKEVKVEDNRLHETTADGTSWERWLRDREKGFICISRHPWFAGPR